MLSLLKVRFPAVSRTADVGWTLDADKAGFIWEAPQRLSRSAESRPKHAKAVTFCPAVIDHENRLFEVTCPIDVRLRFKIDEKTKQPAVANTAGDLATIRPKALSQMLYLVGAKEWRHPDRPIIQLATPYIFLSDEPIYMTQLPPFAHFQNPPQPGVMIGGRMPIHVWPRPMIWAFEWFDTSQELVLRRGEPWFYVRFETRDPSRHVRLIEADLTLELKQYVAGLASVTNFVNRTFSLFETAKARRPKTLLVPKNR
jgi:hypothetical protein